MERMSDDGGTGESWRAIYGDGPLPREETRIISSGNSTLNVAVRRIPRSEMKMAIARDGSVVAASHITRSGVLFYTKHKLIDLPNDLVGLDDLEGLGIDLVHLVAGG